MFRSSTVTAGLFQVVSVDRDSGAGFTTVISLVEGLEEFAGYQVRIQAKNENYIAEKVGSKVEVLACTPDLISVVDSDTGELGSSWKSCT